VSALDLTQLPDRGRCLWVDGYEWGYQHGISHGLELAENQWRGRMEVSAVIARQVARVDPYADLCDRRGEPEAAQAQRQLLAQRGIGPASYRRPSRTLQDVRPVPSVAEALASWEPTEVAP